MTYFKDQVAFLSSVSALFPAVKFIYKKFIQWRILRNLDYWADWKTMVPCRKVNKTRNWRHFRNSRLKWWRLEKRVVMKVRKCRELAEVSDLCRLPGHPGFTPSTPSALASIQINWTPCKLLLSSSTGTFGVVGHQFTWRCIGTMPISCGSVTSCCTPVIGCCYLLHCPVECRPLPTFCWSHTICCYPGCCLSQILKLFRFLLLFYMVFHFSIINFLFGSEALHIRRLVSDKIRLT